MSHLHFILGFALFAAQAFANADCEKRIRDTGMIVIPKDPEIICKQNPSRETQDCLAEVLTKTKGNLRNQDLLEVFGACKADGRQFMRDCMVKGMNKPWNDPGYVSARSVAAKCLLSRKDVIRTKSTKLPSNKKMKR